MKIDAKFYDGKSSKEHHVELEFTKDKRLKIEAFNIDIPLSSIKISSRLGSTPRVIYLPNGQRCKSNQNDKIDAILKSLDIAHSKVHRLEKSWKVALFSIVLIAAFVIFMLTAGADYSAKYLASILPKDSLNYASKQALKQLDKDMLHKSNLSKEKKQKILTLFKKLTNNDPRYKLYFRSSPQMGANAFALPSGDVVLLDELVFLDKDKELRGVLGVLAHEKGHVVYRHGLQSIIKGAVATAIIGYITGDVSYLATTLPTLAITSKYSREFETQADHYAKEKLHQMGISTKPLAKLFTNLEDFYKKKNRSSNYLNWLSSHPVTQKRVEYFMKD